MVDKAASLQLLKMLCEISGREMKLEETLSGAESQSRFPKRLAIRDGRQTNCVDIDSIDWVDAASDYMCVHVDARLSSCPEP